MTTIETIYHNHEGLFQIIAILIGIIIGYISIIQPIIGLTRSQNRINKEQRFKTYHELIDHFSGANGTPQLDRQIAVAYELRRFKEYHPVTKRILTDWKRFQLNAADPNHNRLIEEINKTLAFIEMNWGLNDYLRKVRKTACNMGLASCGVNCLNLSAVFQINFSAGFTV
ncbi:MAG: hypothetical protein ACK5HJ_00790 [Bacteroidota bacterium]|jgi:hypothetical protein